MSVPQIVAGIAGRFGHAPTQVALACALVLAAVSLAACAGPSLHSAAANHSCADRVAEATVSQSVPGLWNCLSPDLQTKLSMAGQSGDGALVNKAFALSYRYLGSTGDLSDYELVLLPAVAQQFGAPTVPLTVWVDPSGRVTNLGVATPAY